MRGSPVYSPAAGEGVVTGAGAGVVAGAGAGVVIGAGSGVVAGAGVAAGTGVDVASTGAGEDEAAGELSGFGDADGLAFAVCLCVRA
jgi:hypothetical protein